MRWGKTADNEFCPFPVHRRVIGARICDRLPRHSLPSFSLSFSISFFLGRLMEFTFLFLAGAIVMLASWRGSRALALGLYAAVMIACAATYLHHATDTLKLSF
jgi:hypothetical protein